MKDQIALLNTKHKQLPPADAPLVPDLRNSHYLRLTYAQLIYAFGFNHDIQNLPDLIQIMGFTSYEALAKERDTFFTNDIYRKNNVGRSARKDINQRCTVVDAKIGIETSTRQLVNVRV